MPPTTEDKTKAADEQAKRDAAAATTGAEAVAEAVKKSADAAVAAAKAAPRGLPQGDFVISGTPGGRFTIRGDGFTASGTVLIDGKQAFTDEWGDELIRGKLPVDVKSGEVVVWIDEKTQKKGYLKV